MQVQDILIVGRIVAKAVKSLAVRGPWPCEGSSLSGFQRSPNKAGSMPSWRRVPSLATLGVMPGIGTGTTAS
jgi:hypothetical protein